jgi:hypothetical protein
MQALHIYAGPVARQTLAEQGLSASHIGTVPGAAGGPKGLVLGALDRFIFGQWLAGSSHTVSLVGASIGAWRLSTACMADPVGALQQLEHAYVHQHYALAPGQKRPTAEFVSQEFGNNLQAFYSGHVDAILQHPRYRLHVLTSRGRHVLGTEGKWRTPLGYLGAYLSNAVHRRAMGAWLERVVFSSSDGNGGSALGPSPLPFGTHDYRTRQVTLTPENFNAALRASCSIPFVLQSVHNIPGAPRGAYWDGGITDYHLHLNYPAGQMPNSPPAQVTGGLVLYPHFQKAVVPGWLDKSLRWRHRATHFLDTTVLLVPNPEWIKTLPNGKLPDRTDFDHYSKNLAGRIQAWKTACSASEQLADEFAQWLDKPDMARVQALTRVGRDSCKSRKKMA